MPTKETNPTVLIVDDDPMIVRMTSRYLLRQGYNVLQANSGTDATALLINENNDVDLMLVDVQLTDMTGLDLIQWSQAQSHNAKYVLISGIPLDDNELPEKTTFVAKPFGIAKIGEVIQQQLTEFVQ